MSWSCKLWQNNDVLRKHPSFSENIRKLPFSIIRTTDYSKGFLRSLALRIIEVWLYIFCFDVYVPPPNRRGLIVLVKGPSAWHFHVQVLCEISHELFTGPGSAVSNMSDYRCISDCRSRGCEFDPGLVPYFRGHWSWNHFYGHSPLFGWFIQEGLLSVQAKVCARSTGCPGKSVVRSTDCPNMTIAVDWDIKQQTNQTKSQE